MVPFSPGLNRDAATQALYQLAGLGSSLGIAIFGGLLTGRWCLVKMLFTMALKKQKVLGKTFRKKFNFEFCIL